MASTPVCKRDDLHIGIQLFGEVLECGVVRCADNGGQLGMQNRLADVTSKLPTNVAQSIPVGIN